MAATLRDRPAGLHPVHVILLVSILPLFLGAALSDLAYGATYQVQWTNFASWLIAGGLVFAGLALVWALVDALRADIPSTARRWLYPLLVLATFLVGLFNALVHAKDAWAAMPAATVLSFIALILAVVAVASAFGGRARP